MLGAQNVCRPKYEGVDNPAKGLNFPLTLRTSGQVIFKDGDFARRKNLQSIQGRRFQVIFVVLTRYGIHMSPDFGLSARRSLPSPDRIRDLTVPRG
jgi:hypothetical protein